MIKCFICLVLESAMTYAFSPAFIFTNSFQRIVCQSVLQCIYISVFLSNGSIKYYSWNYAYLQSTYLGFLQIVLSRKICALYSHCAHNSHFKVHFINYDVTQTSLIFRSNIFCLAYFGRLLMFPIYIYIIFGKCF